MKQKIRKKRKVQTFALIWSILFGLYCLSLLYPIAWAFVMSLKTPGEYLLDKISFPEKAQCNTLAFYHKAHQKSRVLIALVKLTLT